MPTRRDWGALRAWTRPRNLPRPLIAEWDWQFEGNCRDHPIDVFFPEARGEQLRAREEFAKAICRGCPVLTSCRDHALQAPEVYGIWGALTPGERIGFLKALPHGSGERPQREPRNCG